MIEFDDLMRLLEGKELSKGIFWIKDIDNPEGSIVYFDIPCRSSGEILVYDDSINSKNGKTYNHEKTWNSLSRDITDGRDYDYYPRGRVDIRNGKADIFISPHLNTEDVINVIIDKFCLNKYNGINKIRVVVDGSDHYRCHLDY